MVELLLRVRVRMFEQFKNNIEVERDILQKLKIEADENKRQAYVDLINLINRSFPELLKRTSPVASVRESTLNLLGVRYSPNFQNIMILPSDKAFFDQVMLSVNRKDKKEQREFDKKEAETFSRVKPSFVRGLANAFFRGFSEKTISSFGTMEKSIKSANMSVLPATYLAMAYFFTVIVFFLTIAVYGVALFINMELYWTYFWTILVVPALFFLVFVYYPKTEADAVQKEISYELPFATIHMTAIAGSDIEPTKIFQIIATSKEYPNVGKEIQKILVMIRVYGYDLVTALKNVASRTSNVRLAELLGGLATNIAGGGSLKNYLEKKAENYLLDYKLERRKYIDLASTFMDIYISILIAAPMVLMLMFIIMNVAGLGFQGFSLQFLMIISVIAIVIVNIIFLIIINLKQPKV